MRLHGYFHTYYNVSMLYSLFSFNHNPRHILQQVDVIKLSRVRTSLGRFPPGKTEPGGVKLVKNSSTFALLQPCLVCVPANLSVPLHLHSPQQIHKSHSHYPAN